MIYEGPCHRQFTVAWELFRGFDSIPTVVNYPRAGANGMGAMQCQHPGCSYARFNAYELWAHVHFARKHDKHRERKRMWLEFVEDLNR